MLGAIKKAWGTVVKYVSNIIPFRKKKVVVKKKRRAYTKGRAKTIKTTLNNLDDNFKELSKATAKASWINSDITKAMHKIGVYVPPLDARKGIYEDHSNTVDIPEGKFPGLIFVATNDFLLPDDAEEGIPPNFLHATLMNTPPYWVEPTEDTVYEMAMCWPGDKTTKHLNGNAWVQYYVAISPTGEVRTLRWLRDSHITVGCERGNKRLRRHLFKGTASYTRREWQSPNVLNHTYAGELKEEEDRNDMHIWAFCTCFNFWGTRDKMWVVQTKKNNMRMSFCVDTRDTKHFFKDREYVTTDSGSRKKIIHFVEGHNRVTPKGETWVREHIRGERKFIWNRYECNVKTPKFDGLTMGDFTVGSEYFEDGDVTAAETCDLAQVATTLTKALDSEQDNAYSKR